MINPDIIQKAIHRSKHNNRKDSMKPTVGRLVHYVIPHSGTHRPAIVTSVHSATCVDLHVFSYDINEVGYKTPCILCGNSVVQDQSDDPALHTWHWPELEAEDVPRILKDDQPPPQPVPVPTPAKPVYVLGRATIEQVAAKGELQTDHVDFVASDDLFHQNPYTPTTTSPAPPDPAIPTQDILAQLEIIGTNVKAIGLKAQELRSMKDSGEITTDGINSDRVVILLNAIGEQYQNALKAAAWIRDQLV